MVAPRLISELQGPAKRLVVGRRADWVSFPGGVQVLLNTLRASLGKPQVSELADHLTRYFRQTRRKAQESMSDYITRKCETYLRAQQALRRVLPQHQKPKTTGTSGGQSWPQQTWSRRTSVESATSATTSQAAAPVVEPTDDQEPTRDDGDAPEPSEGQWSDQQWSPWAGWYNNWQGYSGGWSGTWGYTWNSSYYKDNYGTTGQDETAVVEILPDFVQGWYLLFDASLNTTERNLIHTAVQGDYSLQRIAQELRSQWDDNNIKPRDSRHQASYMGEDDEDYADEEFETMEGFAAEQLTEEGQALVAEAEEEAQAALAALHQARRTLKEARERQHQVKLSRQYFRPGSTRAPSSSSTSSMATRSTSWGRGRGFGARDDSRMTCLKCGKVGHRAANCSQPEQQAQHVEEQTESAPFICYSEAALSATPREDTMTTHEAMTKGWCVVDGGATRTLGSVAAVQSVLDQNARQTGNTKLLQVDTSRKPTFSFGNSSENQCVRTVSLGVQAGSQGALVELLREHGEEPPTRWTKVELRQRLIELNPSLDKTISKESKMTELQQWVGKINRASVKQANLVQLCQEELQLTLTGNETVATLEKLDINEYQPAYREWVLRTDAEETGCDYCLRRLAVWLRENPVRKISQRDLPVRGQPKSKAMFRPSGATGSSTPPATELSPSAPSMVDRDMIAILQNLTGTVQDLQQEMAELKGERPRKKDQKTTKPVSDTTSEGYTKGVKLILQQVRISQPGFVWLTTPDSAFSPMQHSNSRTDAQKEELQRKRAVAPQVQDVVPETLQHETYAAEDLQQAEELARMPMKAHPSRTGQLGELWVQETIQAREMGIATSEERPLTKKTTPHGEDVWGRRECLGVFAVGGDQVSRDKETEKIKRNARPEVIKLASEFRCSICEEQHQFLVVIDEGSRTLRLDPAGSFRSQAILDFCDRHQIFLDLVPGEAHWKIGVCEQAVQGLKSVMEKVCRAEGTLTAEEALSTAVRIFNQIDVATPNLPPELLVENPGTEFAQAVARRSRRVMDYQPGELVYFWRQQHSGKNRQGPQSKKGVFMGPARILATEKKRNPDGTLQDGSIVWCVRGRQLIKCCVEQLRRASPREELVEALSTQDNTPWVFTKVAEQIGGNQFEDASQDSPQLEEWWRAQNPEEEIQPARRRITEKRSAPPRATEDSDEELVPDQEMSHPSAQRAVASRRARRSKPYAAEGLGSGEHWCDRVPEEAWFCQEQAYWCDPQAGVQVEVEMPQTGKGWQQALQNFEGYMVGAMKRRAIEVREKHLSDEEPLQFEGAKAIEVKNFVAARAFEALPESLRPSKEQAINMRWILTWKQREDGTMKAKARAVLLGRDYPGVLHCVPCNEICDALGVPRDSVMSVAEFLAELGSDQDSEWQGILKRIKARFQWGDWERDTEGSLSWLAQQTAPHLSAPVSLLLSEAKQRKNHSMLIHAFDEDEPLAMFAWVDAGAVGRITPVAWHSSKVERICRSPGAAEAQAAVNGEDTLFFSRYQWGELEFGDVDSRDAERTVNQVVGCLVTDSRNVYDKLNTEVLTIKGAEKRTDLEMLGLKEAQRNTGLHIRWVHSEAQLANSLTKAAGGREIELYYQMRHQWRIVEDPQMRSARRRRQEGIAPLTTDQGDERNI
ncbi:unnamed protein product [Symbiodinium sp. CCMP2456]|nr:unnamed protein product [Symbiodinium sp. CCMP2456]